MMSLPTISNTELITKQLKYKWNAWIGTIFSLLIIQMVGTVLSIFGSSGSSMYAEGFVLRVTYTSGDTIFFLTLFWMLVQAFTIASKNYRDLDYSFVSTRWSSHASTVLYLGCLSMLAAVLTVLLSNFMRVFLYFTKTDLSWSGTSYFLSSSEMVIGVVVVWLYLMMIASIAYLFGTLASYKSWLVVVLPTLVIAIIVLEARIAADSVFIQLVQAFVWEYSLLMFIVKAVIFIVVVFVASYLVNKRMEVRK